MEAGGEESERIRLTHGSDEKLKLHTKRGFFSPPVLLKSKMRDFGNDRLLREAVVYSMVQMLLGVRGRTCES